MHSDILVKAIARAKANGNISGVVSSKVYSVAPQNTNPPYLLISLSDAEDLGDKGAQFIEAELTFDYWSNVEDQGPVLDMINYITDEFHNNPLVLTAGSSNLLMQRVRYNVFKETDGVAQRGLCIFNLIIED